MLKITSNVAKNFDIIATSSNYYFDNSIKFNKITFLIFYPAKILDLSAKPFFSCVR